MLNSSSWALVAFRLAVARPWMCTAPSEIGLPWMSVGTPSTSHSVTLSHQSCPCGLPRQDRSSSMPMSTDSRSTPASRSGPIIRVRSDGSWRSW